MAKIPVLKINESDYENPEVKKLARALAVQLAAISNAFVNNISDENLVIQEYTLQIRLPSDTDTFSPYPFSFTWNYNGVLPREVRLSKIAATDGSRSVIGMPYLDWSFDNNRIVIHGLAGNLTGGKTYNVTIRASG